MNFTYIASQWGKLNLLLSRNLPVIISVMSIGVPAFIAWKANEISETSRLKLGVDTLVELLRLDHDLSVGNPSREVRQLHVDAVKFHFYRELIHDHLPRENEAYEAFAKASWKPNSDYAITIMKAATRDAQAREAESKLEMEAKLKLDREVNSTLWSWWSGPKPQSR
jgi:hypothetical protein